MSHKSYKIIIPCVFHSVSLHIAWCMGSHKNQIFGARTWKFFRGKFSAGNFPRGEFSVGRKCWGRFYTGWIFQNSGTEFFLFVLLPLWSLNFVCGEDVPGNYLGEIFSGEGISCGVFKREGLLYGRNFPRKRPTTGGRGISMDGGGFRHDLRNDKKIK